MENKILVLCMIMVMMFCDVGSDFTQDQKECKEQLISLSPCITFVGGEAKSPSTTCCTELKKDADKSLYCLCVLIKDRNEPDLGFKLNATLALSLLPLCHLHTNSTMCPGLLHLSPNSPEAQVFEQFGNMSGVISNSTSPREIIPSSSTKLSVKGVQGAAIVGVLICVSALCFHHQLLGR